MIPSDKIKGFAFLCDLNGNIEEILRDDFEFNQYVSKGFLFTKIVDESSRKNSLNFLMEIKKKNIAFDYRFDVPHRDKVYNLYFMGLSLHDKIIIIAANNHKEAIDFTNNLQKINNEQSNLIRSLIKDTSLERTRTINENQRLFDEISQLNNELVNLQRELVKKNEELSRLNELKNRFIGMAAHDLRNPLGAILNFSDFLEDETKDQLSEEHLQFLQSINKSASFMLNLVEDLLDFSHIESGKIQLSSESFDIIALFRRIVQAMQTISANKNIHITFNSDKDQFFYHGDPNKLEQVLQNLLGNAIKFSHPKESIKVCLCSEKNKEEILIKVSDTGKGIPEEGHKDLFMPFNKSSSSGTAGEKGTGLGLFIVKSIVEAHKGKIWLESKVNEGTTFYVTLPVSP